MKTLGPRIAAALLFVCGTVSAQQKKPPKPAPPPKPAAAAKPPGNPGRGPQPTAAKELDQFAKMSPKEREKELSKLPPQRRAAFEQRLARYQQMTPEQQDKFKRNLETMEALPKDRQNAVRQEIQRLTALPFPQRRKAVENEAFKQRFSPDEQRLVLAPFENLQKLLLDEHH
jgi:Protein of unknown function (DUF3106)